MLIKKRNKGKKNGGLMYIKHIQTDYKIYTHICTSCHMFDLGGTREKNMQCIYSHRYYWSFFLFTNVINYIFLDGTQGLKVTLLCTTPSSILIQDLIEKGC